jgi:hypothetical protein
LRSPIDGEVVEQNAGFTAAMAFASPSAFEAGWLVRLKTKDLGQQLPAMMTGAKLRKWSRQEMDRLRAFVLSRLPAGVVGATAADGGTLSAGLASQLSDDAWNEAVRLMLGAETDDASDEAMAAAGASS